MKRVVCWWLLAVSCWLGGTTVALANPESIATFHGFGTLTDGGYTATIDGGTIQFASRATWDGNTNGVSVLVRYSGYVQPSANAFLVTLKSSVVGGGAKNAIGVFAQATDGTIHGVWNNGTWTSEDGNSSKVQVCDRTLAEEGYMILTYKGGSGTILYDEEGAILYKATKLMSSTKGQQIGDLITVGSAAATMKIEGVRIFKGTLSAGEIAAAVADFESSEPPDEPTYDWTKWCENQSYTSTPLAKDITAGKQIKVAFKGVFSESDMASVQLAYFHGDTNDIYLNTDENGYAVLKLNRNTTKDSHSVTSTVAIAEGEHQFGLFVRRGTSSGGHVVSIVVTMDGKQLVALGDGTLTFDTHPMRQLYLGDAEKTGNVFTSYYVEPETAIDNDVESVKTLINDVKVLFRMPEIIKDESAHTWTVDTTKAAYAFTANEIGELKSTKWQVTLKSASVLGATVDFGSISAAQKSHFVIESGTHAMTWVNGNANINFTTDATADDPSILVKGGAALDFTVRDFTGWSGSAANKTGNIVRVNEGGVLNLLQSGSYTHYYQGRYWLDPGATATADFAENTFRINGGATEGCEQLYVPDSTNGSAEAAFTVANKLRIHHDNTPGLGIYVGENSRLAVNADITSDGAYPLAKWGAGMLKIDGALTGYTGTLTAHAGTLALTQPALGGGLAMEAGTALSVLFDGEVTHGTIVLTAQSLEIASGVQLLVNGTNHEYSIDGGNLVVEKAVAEAGGKKYGTIADAVAVAGNGGRITLLVEKEAIQSEIDAAAVTLTQVEGNVYTVSFNMTEGAALVITEIMPKPTDAQDRGSLAGMDPNGLESGWVEVENTSDNWADLKDYRFIRVNRSKKTDVAGYGNFPSRLIAPHAKAVFYTSERYANSADMTVSAFATAVESEKPTIFTNLHNIVVWPDKVNPKKFPFVRLYYAPGGTIQSTVDTVVIPSDLPEGASIIVEPIEEGKATIRYICEAPTCGTANPSVEGLEKLGPNVGPLYEISTQKKHDSASEFGIVPPAKIGEDYAITFAFNPTMHPTESQTNTGTFRSEDAITNIQLVYRTCLDDTTLTTTNVSMTATWDKGDKGYTYAATIPHAAFDGVGAGQIIQWKFVAMDASGNTWTSPSFHNKDDGYEWYGTITEPGDLNSAKLPTWHMFVDDESKAQMDTDADQQTLPYNARVAIYDASTSNYYDYVRIDLRGHTSAHFTKKGHGLRFAKAHPLTMRDIVSGEDIEEIRKTSLISEMADPSYMRQMVAFWLFRKMGNHAPFDFPVRCNLNGEFYQLAFNSERFTDELIEDVYKLDKYGYSWKNVGKLESGGGTSAGDIEKKTPDDEDETNVTVLENDLRKPLKDLGIESIPGTTTAALSDTTTDPTGLNNTELTKFVVKKFDLPAWLNYLASARITQEMDDVWANLSIYYDNPDMKEGARGTGTWSPLGYDFNISFGQYYFSDIGGTRTGVLMVNQDWFKSHPFYGGQRVRCWKSDAYSANVNNGNRGFEAVWQNAKFRRLYLRRLRTLMDQELKEPGTDETEVPFMAEMRRLADLMRTDAAADRAKYPWDGSFYAIDVWGKANFPQDMDAGIDEIWDNYVVPRQTHLYVTHAATNTAKTAGYGSRLSAGIPEAQSPIAELKGGFSAAFDATDGVTVVSNMNNEAVDMSGWKLEGPMTMTLPAGTVVDSDDVIYIVTDRRAYVAAQELTDQVIVGNAEAGEGEADIVLKTADDIVVIAPVVKSEQEKYLRLWGFCGAPDGGDADKGEFIIFTNLNAEVALDATMANIWIHKTGEVADKCHFDLPTGSVVPAGGFLRFEQTWKKITDGDVNIYLTASNGVSIYAKEGLSQKNLGVKETGYYAVYDVAADSWSKQLIVQSPGYVLPITPGQSTTYKSEEVATNAAAKAVVLRPENEVTNVISAADYNDLFSVRAVQTAMSTWELVTELKPAVSNAVQTAVDAAVSDATLMATMTTETPTASVQTQAGLYYGLATTDEVGGIGTVAIPFARWVLGTGASQELTADKPSDMKGFYQIRVQIAPPTE